MYGIAAERHSISARKTSHNLLFYVAVGGMASVRDRVVLRRHGNNVSANLKGLLVQSGI